MQDASASEKQGRLSSGKRRSPLVATLVTLITFIAGFFSHAAFFPDMSFSTMLLYGEYIIGTKTPATLALDGEKEKPSEIVEVIKNVSYKDGAFKPSTVRVHYGNYIAIENQSEQELMWLQSSLPELSTPRGFALSEKLQVVLLKEGTHQVINKANQSARLTVVVYR
ncbi:MAG: hypothetical protein UZ21_OP11001000942 [Microgenomates bacterium OLB22]|nr:MAG: hypothetical protein UZ21_OP11001000942 [Microgenomates bacterium OLB22]